MNDGRAPSGQAGRASHGAASSTASPPFGDHPSREDYMAEIDEGKPRYEPRGVDPNGLVHLAVRTEREAAQLHWTDEMRERLLGIARHLREIAREDCQHD